MGLASCGPRMLIISRTMKEEEDRIILHKVLVICLIFVQNSIVYFAKPYFYFCECNTSLAQTSVSASAGGWLCGASEPLFSELRLFWNYIYFMALRGQRKQVLASGNVQRSAAFVIENLRPLHPCWALGSLSWYLGAGEPHHLLNDFLWAGNAKGRSVGDVLGS